MRAIPDEIVEKIKITTVNTDYFLIRGRTLNYKLGRRL